MVTNQKILDSLKQIGLNLYERKLWLALLSRGTSTAGELSSLAKVPHSRAYDILETLTDKGFVLTQNTKPLKYVAIPPIEALERVKKRMQIKFDNSIERVNDFKGSVITKELNKVFKEGVSLVSPSELTASLKGHTAFHNQLETLIKGAKKEISIITNERGLKDIHEKHSEHLRKASKRGVKVRIGVPGLKKAPSHFKGLASVKTLSKKIDGRFCLIDNNHVVFSLTDNKKTHPTQDLSIWTQSEHAVANMLAPMFNSVWDQ